MRDLAGAPAARTVALVGNGPVAPGAEARIDAADWVVRFNKARGFGGRAGSRIDDLFLVNCGGQMHEWLGDAAFWRSPPVLRAAQVTLPIPAGGAGPGMARLRREGMAALDGINFEHDARARLAHRAGVVRVLPADLQADAVAALAALGPLRGRWPSTGFLAMAWYDRVLELDARIVLHGFSFEGYAGHPWPQERAWVEDRPGRIALAAPVAA